MADQQEAPAWNPKLYVVTRKDLIPGAQACQAIHAAHLAGDKFGLQPDGHEPHLVFLGAPNEEALLRAAEKLERREIPFVLWCEPDLGDRATALATTAMPEEGRWFPRGYRMWNSSTSEIQNGN